MNWNELQKEAKANGIKIFGKGREALEAELAAIDKPVESETPKVSKPTESPKLKAKAAKKGKIDVEAIAQTLGSKVVEHKNQSLTLIKGDRMFCAHTKQSAEDVIKAFKQNGF